jgi:hypothetical protein
MFCLARARRSQVLTEGIRLEVREGSFEKVNEAAAFDLLQD